MKTVTKVIIVMLIITVALIIIFSDTTEKISNFKVLAWSMLFTTTAANGVVVRQWLKSRKAVCYADAIAPNDAENRAFCLASGPDNQEAGYFWSYTGFSAFPGSSPPYDGVVVALGGLVVPGRNVIFKGLKEPVSPEMLMKYLQGNKRLYDRIMSAVIQPPNGKIYVITRLPWHIEKQSYSLKGGFPLGTDKFNSVARVLLRHLSGLNTLKKVMTDSYNDSMFFGENAVRTAKRVSKDVQEARGTGVPQHSQPVRPGGEEYMERRS